MEGGVSRFYRQYQQQMILCTPVAWIALIYRTKNIVSIISGRQFWLSAFPFCLFFSIRHCAVLRSKADAPNQWRVWKKKMINLIRKILFSLRLDVVLGNRWIRILIATIIRIRRPFHHICCLLFVFAVRQYTFSSHISTTCNYICAKFNWKINNYIQLQHVEQKINEIIIGIHGIAGEPTEQVNNDLEERKTKMSAFMATERKRAEEWIEGLHFGICARRF